MAGSVSRARCTNGTGIANEIVHVLPDKGILYKGHAGRSIFVDDHGFYTGIGDPLNASEPDEDRERMWYYTLDGKHRKLLASGVRNVEKLQFRPGTHEVWGMDHGSDAFGQGYGEKSMSHQPITDEYPREKFLHFEPGSFFGHPYFIEGRFPRPEFMKRKDLLKLAARVPIPDMLYGPHWAPDGWCFYTGDKIPDGKGDAFMAFHGSWNRMHKAGYRIERTLFDKVTGKPYGHYMIVHTLGGAEKVLARPVDVIQGPDGDLLWSDDWGRKVYRLSYVGTK
jgi:glucose/arabinose dehydrogenase